MLFWKSIPIKRGVCWRVSRRRLVRVVIGLGGGALLSAVLLAAVIVRYGSQDRARPADVIVVLGGGTSGTLRRTEHAVRLYRQGLAPYLICTGGRQDHTRSEAALCAQVAQDGGVPAVAIIEESHSLSTEENALQAARIMRQRGWQEAVLVSDNFHLWRAVWWFKRQGITVWPSPAQQTSGSLRLDEMTYCLLREMAAVSWQVGKSLLGLSSTAGE